MREKILVTGADGLIGSAIKRIAKSHKNEFIFASRKDADLTSEIHVKNLFSKEKPDFVIHAAAKVGGIGANLKKPAEFFYENIMMNSLILHYAWKYQVKKCLAFSSVCSYPDKVEILKEDLQQFGKPCEENFAYGYAKRMIDTQIKAYRLQYGCNFCALVPANLYGCNDNYDLNDGHIIPSIIHKCFLAKKENKPLECWGDGSPLREFIFADDVAELCLRILFSEQAHDAVIVSNPIEYSIKEVVHFICKYTKYDGPVQWSSNRLNGQHRRPSDISRLKKIAPNFNYTNLDDGIKKSVEWFADNYPNLRGAH